jgi:ketosteroid isomerase-like protein
MAARILTAWHRSANGCVVLVRASGTNTEGGAFESIYATLVRYRDDRVAGYEFFEPEHLDAALARLAALDCRAVGGAG